MRGISKQEGCTAGRIVSMRPHKTTDPVGLMKRLCESNYASVHKDWEINTTTFIFDDESWIMFDSGDFAGWGNRYVVSTSCPWKGVF